MPWKKGQSGNPLGRLPGEKQFADQLRIVLAEPVDKNDPKSVRKMRRIAEKLAECALNGDPWAIAQVADRIDGKPKQESDVSVASTRYVVEVPADLSDEEWEKPPPKTAVELLDYVRKIQASTKAAITTIQNRAADDQCHFVFLALLGRARLPQAQDAPEAPAGVPGP
jgi:Family of unknown function (DUF5681)